MFQLRTLGTLDLRDAAGVEVRTVLQQPKRLALLVYLAIEGGPRWVRRDVLLNCFWPELDQTHARAALRRALYFLRRSLGEEVLETRGDEELRIRPGSLWCDVTAFANALAGGDLQGALSLYGGPMMEGLYVAGAPEAEHWLDTARDRLRRDAAGAAWTLAENPDVAPSVAVEWGRRAVRFLPDDEDAVRRLLQLFDRLGDPHAALATYAEYARRLRLDLETEPSVSLTQLAHSIQRKAGTPGRPPTHTAAPARVAVLPFTVRGDPALAYLGEGLVDLLSAALDGVDDLRLVDTNVLLAEMSDDAEARHPAEIARAVGADRWIHGSVLVTGGRIRIIAAMEEPSGATLSRAEAQGEGEAAVFDLVDEVVRQLLSRRVAGPSERMARLASRTTGSLPALRAWLEGEHEFRLSRALAALDAYRRAALADPGFALAHYRTASAAAASAFIGPARSASALAVELRDRLSERERLLVEAQHAWLHGATDDAERRYAAAVAEYPDDLEAWFLLGDLLFHGNPYRGRSIRAARGPLERAVALDPRHVSSLVKLARLAALDRDWSRLASLVDRVLAQSPAGDQALGMRALRAFGLGRTEERRQVVDELRHAPALGMAVAFSDLALYGGDLPAVTGLGRELVPVFRSPELQALGHLALAHIALAQGDLTVAEEELARGEALDRAWGLELRGLLSALPFIPWSQAQVTAAREALAAWDPTAAPPNVGLPLAFHNGLHSHLRLYLLGLLAARQEDLAGLIEAGESLAELPVPEEAPVLVERLERSLRTELLVLRSQPALALAELAGAPTDIWFQYAVASPFYGGAFERWRRATLLAAVGRKEEAQGWLGAIAERSPWELPFRRAVVPQRL
jgi:DNA-binding SARP family transcriptional activator